MNNKGFTLLEMLVVLIVVSSIFFITSFNYLNSNDNHILRQETEMLGKTLEAMQLNSLSHNQPSKISIKNSGFACYLEDTLIYEHDFEKELNIDSNFPSDEIKITEDGTVTRGGSVSLTLGGDTLNLIINISMGRYKIE